MSSSPSGGRYAVFGNPIAHSKSPRIHELFAASVGERIDYGKRLAPTGGFADALEQFRQEGGVGANVTVPFKQDAFALAGESSLRARQAGAANFLAWRGDHWYCDNTDGAGLIRDIEVNQRIPLHGKRVLLLGAGGASRGVLGPLLLRAPQKVVIVNRTDDRAVALVAAHADQAVLSAQSVARLLASGETFDVVINATSASLNGALPLPDSASVFAEGAFAYDMMYGREPTPFMVWARQRGAAEVSDGLGMLVEQAAESFLQWRGVMPDSAAVIALLRAEVLG